MKTMDVLRFGLPFARRRRPADLFSAEEIDGLNVRKLVGLDREQLTALRQKLADTYDWLEPVDGRIGPLEMKAWKKRLVKLNDLMDAADGLLEPEVRQAL